MAGTLPWARERTWRSLFQPLPSGEYGWASLNLPWALSLPQSPGAGLGGRGAGSKEGPRLGERGSMAASHHDHTGCRCRRISSSAPQSCSSHLTFCRQDGFPFIKSKHGVKCCKLHTPGAGGASPRLAPREEGPRGETRGQAGQAVRPPCWPEAVDSRDRHSAGAEGLSFKAPGKCPGLWATRGPRCPRGLGLRGQLAKQCHSAEVADRK